MFCSLDNEDNRIWKGLDDPKVSNSHNSGILYNASFVMDSLKYKHADRLEDILTVSFNPKYSFDLLSFRSWIPSHFEEFKVLEI